VWCGAKHRGVYCCNARCTQEWYSERYTAYSVILYRIVSYTRYLLSYPFNPCPVPSHPIFLTLCLSRLIMTGNATAKLLIQGSMVTVGFLSQMRGYNMGTENGLMRIILSPIIIAEACVQAYVLAAMLKQDQ
jgi:hypothetical protein